MKCLQTCRSPNNFGKRLVLVRPYFYASARPSAFTRASIFDAVTCRRAAVACGRWSTGSQVRSHQSGAHIISSHLSYFPRTCVLISLSIFVCKHTSTTSSGPNLRDTKMPFSISWFFLNPLFFCTEGNSKMSMTLRKAIKIFIASREFTQPFRL